MRKNLHDKILKGKPKEQHLNTIPNSYFYNFCLKPQTFLGALLPNLRRKGL